MGSIELAGTGHKHSEIIHYSNIQLTSLQFFVLSSKQIRIPQNYEYDEIQSNAWKMETWYVRSVYAVFNSLRLVIHPLFSFLCKNCALYSPLLLLLWVPFFYAYFTWKTILNESTVNFMNVQFSVQQESAKKHEEKECWMRNSMCISHPNF